MRPIRTLCLCNRKARSAGRVDLEEMLGKRKYWGNVTYHYLQPADIFSPTWLADAENADRILIVGGDGTLHHAIQHLIGRPVEISVLPAGNANDFARWIGLSLDPLKSLNMLERGKTIKYDTINANGRHVLTGGGLGLGHSVVESTLRLRGSSSGILLGRLAKEKVYPFLLLWHALVSRHTGHSLTIDDNGEVRQYRSHACVFTNQPTLGKSIVVAPNTDSTDGLFHFLLFRNPSCRSVLYSVCKIKMGFHDNDRYQYRKESKRIVIRCHDKLPAFGDGELMPPSNSWSISSHRASLNIRVPEYFNER